MMTAAKNRSQSQAMVFSASNSCGMLMDAHKITTSDSATLSAAEARTDVQMLDCLTLADLAQGQPIDLLHLDIRGTELDYVCGNFNALNAQVKRGLIGTHGRQIEGALCKHFLDADWRMEMDRLGIWSSRNPH